MVGDAFGVVQSAVDKVKGALDKIPFDKIKGGLGSIGSKAQETLGPVFSAAATGMGDLFDNPNRENVWSLGNSQGKCSATRH